MEDFVASFAWCNSQKKLCELEWGNLVHFMLILQPHRFFGLLIVQKCIYDIYNSLISFFADSMLCPARLHSSSWCGLLGSSPEDVIGNPCPGLDNWCQEDAVLGVTVRVEKPSLLVLVFKYCQATFVTSPWRLYNHYNHAHVSLRLCNHYNHAHVTGQHMAGSGLLALLQVLQNRVFMLIVRTLSAQDCHWQNPRRKFL